MIHGKISIIVPVYNVEKYLQDCVHSLMNQTYQNIEIILIDDGSTDDSGNIVDRFAKIDARIVSVHTKNGGPGAARNVGLQYAKGEYIAFADSDDCLAVNYCEKLLEVMLHSQADIVECHNNILNENDCIIDDEHYTTSQLDTIELTPKEWICQSGLKDFLSCVVWNKLYKRELFDSIQFPAEKYYEDEATVYKIVWNAKKVVRIPDRLYFYRQRPGSIVNSEKTPQKVLWQLESLMEKCAFFERGGEFEIADFTYSKLLIAICSNYRLIDNSDALTKYKKVVKQYLSRVMIAKNVPTKYKLYIACNSLKMLIH